MGWWSIFAPGFNDVELSLYVLLTLKISGYTRSIISFNPITLPSVRVCATSSMKPKCSISMRSLHRLISGSNVMLWWSMSALVGFLSATVMEQCSRTEGFWILQCYFFFNPTSLPSVCSTSRSRETNCSIRLPLVGTLHTLSSGFLRCWWSITAQVAVMLGCLCTRPLTIKFWETQDQPIVSILLNCS